MENLDEGFLEKAFIETEYLCEMYIFFFKNGDFNQIKISEKLKELISPLKTENEELLKKVDELNLTFEHISIDLANKNLEISTQINLNQELKQN